MREPAQQQFAGLVIGQEFESNAHAVLRVVAIDPELRCVLAEDGAGVSHIDDIEHFTSTHRPNR
jgi:hypothetical protein